MIILKFFCSVFLNVGLYCLLVIWELLWNLDVVCKRLVNVRLSKGFLNIIIGIDVGCGIWYVYL